MKDNEIIKALECCVQNTREACVECPIGFEGRDLCLNVAIEEAIGLINRQKAEIEELQHKIMSCNSEIDKLKSKLPQGFEQADPMDFCGVLCDFAEELIEKAKSEAIKAFADSLHEKLYSIPTIYNSHFGRMVDNLVKEMTEQTTFEKVEHNSLCETETYKGGE